MPGGKVTNSNRIEHTLVLGEQGCASNPAISGSFAELLHFLSSRTSQLLQDFKLTGAG